MRDRQTCVGCGKQSPETETNYTLISAQFGWRLTRYKSPDGTLIVEWRCPTCWREYKRARVVKPGESNPPPPSSRPSQAPPPMLRSTNPRPPTPFEAFRVRPPSNPADSPARRSSNPSPPPSYERYSPLPEPRSGPASRPPPSRPSQMPSPPLDPPPGRSGRGSR